MTHKAVTRKTYLAIFAWLAFLTALEIGAAAMPIPRLAMVVFLLATALSKMILIMLYFMHLKFESRWIWVLPGVPAALGIFFLLMLFPDIVYHLTHVFG